MILALTILSLILVSITGAIGFFITQEIFHSNHKTIIPSKSSFTYCWLIGALGAALLITCSIMWGLWKSKTGWKQTDRTITRLIRVMIETQIPPTLLLIVFFIFAYACPSTYLDVYPLWLQSKFYTCSLLASLNSRYSLRRAIAHGSSSGRTTSKPPIVHVLTETYVQSDDHQGLPQKDQPKPRYLLQHDTFSTRKTPAQDPLDFDEISLELEHVPDLKGTTPDTEGEMSSSHKLDYINNESRTGLTDERKQVGHYER
nr:hypothetical protein I302_07481 [Kwoniella bestiolae CBS 10118]OCF23129.1 hypothetical protein I302_07481 [Kwoniella bestiolae CBS 10118]